MDKKTRRGKEPWSGYRTAERKAVNRVNRKVNLTKPDMVLST
jgi:tRNA(Ser,Leu) C12 N-acetylase TAN1